MSVISAWQLSQFMTRYWLRLSLVPHERASCASTLRRPDVRTRYARWSVYIAVLSGHLTFIMPKKGSYLDILILSDIKREELMVILVLSMKEVRAKEVECCLMHRLLPPPQGSRRKSQETVIYEFIIINITFFFYLYPKLEIKCMIMQNICLMSLLNTKKKKTIDARISNL